MKRSAAALLFLFLFCVFCAWSVGSRVIVQNVFDEMYYAQGRTSRMPWTLTNYHNTQINQRNEDFFRYYRETNFWENYHVNGFLNDDEAILLRGDMENKTISFVCRVGYDGYVQTSGDAGTALWFKYSYHVEIKILTLEPLSISSHAIIVERDAFAVSDVDVVSEFLASQEITPEKIQEWNDYFLYQKILKDWFRANGVSRFSLRNLGNLEIIDNQFPDD